MTRKTPTLAEQAASDQAHFNMLTIEHELREAHRRGLLVPPGWKGVAHEPPLHAKTRVTIRLDDDLVKWFRGFGPGYQKRINRVLRLFMLQAISGELEGKWERGWDGALRRTDL